MTSGEPFPVVDPRALPWLSVEQMREVDRIMVDELGISLVRMMENGGRGLAEVARDLLGGDAAERSVLVLAGPGGNGGGGLVAARHLTVAGRDRHGRALGARRASRPGARRAARHRPAARDPDP
jgi:NAD(P)H-hydrate epimerase